MTDKSMMAMQQTGQEGEDWIPVEYKQVVQPHGDIDQQDTQYAVVKFADMSEAM